MSNENNKFQIDIENLFKQNVNDLTAIKELYRKLKEVEEKISQIKYIDSNLANKLKKEYEKLKRIILDENVSATLSDEIKTVNENLSNEIETINENLSNEIETINENLTNDIESINSEFEIINSELDTIATIVNNGDELNKAINEGKKYILIKEGTHNIGTLTIKNPQTIIKGKGIKSTILNGEIIVPLSCHNTVIEDLRIDGNGYDVGIDLGKGGKNQVQDVGYILNKVRVVNSKIGITVNENVRGCSLNNIIVGDCETGYMIKGTDNEFISCICGSISYNGFEILASNNRFISCKSFCCGTSNKYGSGYYINSSFHLFSACESQQNKFENLVMFNAYSCIIQMTCDGAGWGSSDNMQYNNTNMGYGVIPISSLLLHNTQNCKLDISIINGRNVGGELWKCSKGLYIKYPLTCKENIINIVTRNTRDDFNVFEVGDIDRFTTANSVTVDNINYNMFYGVTLNYFEIDGARSNTLTIIHPGNNTTNIIKEIHLPKDTKKIGFYTKNITYSNIDNTALNFIIQVAGKDSEGSNQYPSTGALSFNDRTFHLFDLTDKINMLATVEDIIVKIHVKPKTANNNPIIVTLSDPKINCYY